MPVHALGPIEALLREVGRVVVEYEFADRTQLLAVRYGSSDEESANVFLGHVSQELEHAFADHVASGRCAWGLSGVAPAG